MRRLRLILGDQLNVAHSWFKNPPANSAEFVLYVLMEVRTETDYVVHHAQKVLGIFAAMRGFAAALQAAGFSVHYLRICDPANQQDFIANLQSLIQRFQITHLERQQADEFRLETILEQAPEKLGIPVHVVDSEHFLLKPEQIQEQFRDKIPRMEFFYRALRKQFHILLDEAGQPLGGQWNFDRDNRKPWRGTPSAPPWPQLAANLADIWRDIENNNIRTLGEPSAEQFPWPISRQQAKQWLAHFIQQGLPHFGEFQDAMSCQSPSLFHAGISFALNLKMLHPMEVIQAALQEFHAGKVEIATAEGFIRQILGWREYVRAVYWARMPQFAALNVLHHRRPLPEWYWTGDTKMQCLRFAISQSLSMAYAHHIQRLMVTGNFALLAGCAPDAVDAWYLGIYIDAFEWVEMPNTRGMSQYADGGMVGSKPYVGSASYINKMSDYCRGCYYNPKIRQGDKACPFNSLYWHFYNRHQARLRNNPRIGMAYKLWAKMAVEEREKTLAQAEVYLANLDAL